MEKEKKSREGRRSRGRARGKETKSSCGKERSPSRAREGDAAPRWQLRCQVGIFAKLGEEICQVEKNAKLGCQIIGSHVFLFCQKFVDAKLIWQTLGDALSLKVN